MFENGRVNRNRAAALATETLNILTSGDYIAPSGRRVDLSAAITASVEGTRSYRPGTALPAVLLPKVPLTSAALSSGALSAAPLTTSRTRLEVTGETTLAAARRLHAAGRSVAALNFASARHPGGGFRTGATAQEESLARSSALFACINGNEMYAVHERSRDPFYTDHVIYSPGVPVFRTDDGELLDDPYPCTFLTCAAVNAGVVRERHPERVDDIGPAMRRRVARVLAIAAIHQEDTLVLGAWGCGVFGNDPALIGRLFAEALAGEYRDTFATTVFAVYDPSPDAHIRRPFEEALSEVTRRP
jgi:uncharacterized protein (TIGR02452 family)